jgi:hypothetical protein
MGILIVYSRTAFILLQYRPRQSFSARHNGMPMETTHPQSASPCCRAEARISAVVTELAQALRRLLETIPGGPYRPQALARKLGINKNISHRLMTAIRKRDPLATAHIIPGPEPLRRVAKAARAQSVPAALADRVEAAIRAFEDLIKNDCDDRPGLDAIISASLPKARDEFEKNAKRTLHSGARQMRGIAADLQFGSYLIHPAAQAGWCDVASISGHLGLRRIRPEAKLKLGVLRGSSNPDSRILTLARRPIVDPNEIIWRRFCSGAEVVLTVHPCPEKGALVYELAWNGAVGPQSARNIVLCDLTLRAIRRHRLPEYPQLKGSLSEYVPVPARAMIFDLLVHKDVYPDWQPRLRIIEPGLLGATEPNDATRDLDVLAMREEVESLGCGLENFRADEIPHYLEMLSEACEKLGWDPQSFRGHRVHIEYPVFGTEVQHVIDMPPDPAATRVRTAPDTPAPE